jgi:hypothetical protein
MMSKTVRRFGEKDVYCLGCGEFHYFDMSLKQVACPHEHPLDYPKDFKFDRGIWIDVDFNVVNKNSDDVFEKLEADLCFHLDKMVYLPVKEELSGKGVTYSLGMRKEDFKSKIHELIEKAKKELK